MSGLAVIVLAAGQGTRMKSSLPKVLHPVCGVPMARHILDAARKLTLQRLIVVVGHGAEAVRAALDAPDVTFVEQPELRGTADAVRRCRAAAQGCDEIMVLNGDSPLVRADLLNTLRAARASAPLAFVTCSIPEPARMGRVARDARGVVTGIVEAADYTGPAGPAEINAGQYVFEAAWLWDRIEAITVSPKGEYYLTVLPALAHREGPASVTVSGNPAEVLGIDDRVRLAEAEATMRQRILRRHMLNGVTVIDPATTYIDASVRIARDVTIHPVCALSGDTTIASDTEIGPATTLRSSAVGARTRISQSVIEDSRLGEGVRVGPFAHVRGNSTIGDGCVLGNYAEVNRSTLGRGVKMHHFSYLGDATVGDGANIAAGVITCNYDGVNKNPTVIGAGAFVGCDTMLVAPVTMGDGSLTGAGTVLRQDLPPGARAVGAPARILAERTGD